MLRGACLFFIMAFTFPEVYGRNFTLDVQFDADVFPTCSIKIDRELWPTYWAWRVGLGMPVDVERDIAVLYKFYRATADQGDDIKIGLLYQRAAFCDARFLGSEELGRVMNSIGMSLSPRYIYYFIVNTLVHKDLDVALMAEPMSIKDFELLLTSELISDLDPVYNECGDDYFL